MPRESALPEKKGLLQRKLQRLPQRLLQRLWRMLLLHMVRRTTPGLLPARTQPLKCTRRAPLCLLLLGPRKRKLQPSQPAGVPCRGRSFRLPPAVLGMLCCQRRLQLTTLTICAVR